MKYKKEKKKVVGLFNLVIRFLSKIGAVYAMMLLISANLITSSIIISVLNYDSQLLNIQQNKIFDLISSTHQLISLQGNISQHTRNVLLNQFTIAADRGGFATHKDLVDLRASLISLLNSTTLHEQQLLALQPLFATNNTVTNSSSINIPTNKLYFLTDAFFDDQGWGTAGFNGILRLNASITDGIPISSILISLTQHANKNPKMIIAQGFQWGDAVLKVAQSHPNIKFVVMTGLVKAKNVASIYPAQQQGSFLLGALAAMMSKTHIIGFVGGQEYPNIINVEDGYKQGAHYIDPNTKVLSQYTFDFNNITKGREMGLSEINQGADILLHTADTSGQGVIQAAKEKNVYALGAVSDQNHLAPNTVLSSFVVDMTKAYTQAYNSVIDNKFVGNITRPGLETGINGPGNGIIFLAPFHGLDSNVPITVKQKISELTHDIMTGKIIVPERDTSTP